MYLLTRIFHNLGYCSQVAWFMDIRPRILHDKKYGTATTAQRWFRKVLSALPGPPVWGHGGIPLPVTFPEGVFRQPSPAR